MDDTSLPDEAGNESTPVNSIMTDGGVLSSAPEDVMDIDEAEEAFGKTGDENGPHELGIE